MTVRIALLVLGAALAACQTPQSRIRRNQAAFDAFPPEVQAAVREGRAEVGFTEQQVLMALGKPDRVYSQKTADAAREVWAYGLGGEPSVGVGFGLSRMSYGNGGGSAYGSSVGVRSALPDGHPRVRYIFEDGKVVSVERRER